MRFWLKLVLAAFLAPCAMESWNVAAGEPAAGRPEIRYGQWRSSRIGGGGYSMKVVFCPSNPKRLYAWTDCSGIFRSDDAGLTWRMLHGALPPEHGSYNPRTLLVDPRDDRKIIVATGTR